MQCRVLMIRAKNNSWPFSVQFPIMATQNLIMIVSNYVLMANQNFSLASQTQSL